MNGQWTCPHCNSQNCRHHKTYQTGHNGTRLLWRCQSCNRLFSETKATLIEGLRKPTSFIIQVLKTRTEGIGLNAACRAFAIAKNTLLLWERRLADCKDVLVIYALTHTFIEQLIEGDELYTKVNRNVPPEDCEGWTIVLMERASRFIWALQCGKKDRSLFSYAIQILRDVILRTGDITLVTDGERRYGNLLFEICHEVLRTGKRGRPPKVLRRGVKVRLKNKGKGTDRTGHSRPKYETPHPEHPETDQDVTPADIHANHLEASNASFRRKNSAYRRRTNTYAKSISGLQRTLDMLWIVHNFIRSHFTTKQVPAVALGILQQGLSWDEVLRVRQPRL
ncbi:IS1 family transposase [Candidatus Thiodictyon syntrophicum]|uniref:IS1 family transposase n=1 Tax=Candidatus Thiodictyon syntrophicum TaxID=1166950 RepID=A0A2K8U5F8_9GAMM|nr:IS1 family transposase [Candidatus Thiodictyon syntrophicum]AUB80271.1 IS1 family transposase [Candidatus Thiodictyon syntrophicum]